MRTRRPDASVWGTSGALSSSNSSSSSSSSISIGRVRVLVTAGSCPRGMPTAAHTHTHTHSHPLHLSACRILTTRPRPKRPLHLPLRVSMRVAAGLHRGHDGRASSVPPLQIDPPDRQTTVVTTLAPRAR